MNGSKQERFLLLKLLVNGVLRKIELMHGLKERNNDKEVARWI